LDKKQKKNLLLLNIIMEGAKLVSELIQKYQPQEILDLKARKGYFSILAASYGAHVDVLDDPNTPEFPDYLKDHPNITYAKTKIEDFVFKKKYDLVIAKHVVMFYPQEFVINQLMQNIHDYLQRNGMTFITYHFADSYAMQTTLDLYQYNLDDFKGLKGKFLVKDF
jgi:2-polyprenyl-3-methyl-5-hydroxy-6-metoxy-1,4-benzoquinol methylase